MANVSIPGLVQIVHRVEFHIWLLSKLVDRNYELWRDRYRCNIYLHNRSLNSVAWGKKSEGHTALIGRTSIVLLQVALQFSKVVQLPTTMKPGSLFM